MLTRRIVYILALAFSALFYMLYAYWFSWYLLVLLLLLIPFDLLISLPGMLTKRLSLSAPKTMKQGSEGRLAISIHTLGPFPIRCVKARLRIVSEDYYVSKRIVFGYERGAKLLVKIDTSRSGVTIFEVKRILSVSLVGLFALPTTANCAAAVLVLPEPERPRLLSLPRGTVLQPKPGGGLSDEHDLRPYRPGDPVRSIHWKASAKHDSLILREPLVPPRHNRLVRVRKWNDRKERDLILARLLWLSDYLLKSGMGYSVMLGDAGTPAEITQQGELEEFLFRALSGASAPTLSPARAPARYAWEFCVDASAGEML